MNPPSFPPRILPFHRGGIRRLLPTLCGAALLGGLAAAQAQVALPTAVPVASPAPSPVASPGPVPSDPALCLPLSATVQLAGLSVAAPASQPNGGSKARASATSAVAIPSPVLSLPVSSPDLFAPTKLLAGKPQAATVTLTYNLLCAGAKVLVAPLDGGTVTGASGGHTATVGADGTLAFTFQAPAGPGRYHVVTRLGSAEIALPFDVAAPAPNSSPAASGK